MTLFQKIINKEIPAKVIYEDHKYLAFLDISQATKGHTLVIPKEATENILTASPETVAGVNGIAQRIAKAYVRDFGAKGVNILSNANEIAGQTVNHYHVHVLPRFSEGELDFTFKSNEVDLDALHKEIKAKLEI